mmetsp:Transcript_77075/g.115934  ORF Transcript_77075/g.115934 Transcript_77075/m.115934 type:complete len:353 (-) Transcript_77075:82-1140(-)
MPPLSKQKHASHDSFDRICGWTGRMFLLLLSGGGLALSLLAGFSCEFFSFENSSGGPWIGLVPPFDGTIAADIGLFSYRITDSIIPAEETESCTRYDDMFFELSRNNEGGSNNNNNNNGMGNLWITAQICAVAAVTAGGLAFLYILLETVSPCLSYPWLIPAFLLFVAFGCQCCTFLIFMETTFCFRNESSHDCRLEPGGWYAIGSVVGNWLGWLIACNLPRTEDGCFLKKRRSLEDDKFDDEHGEAEEEEVADTPTLEMVDAEAETQTVTVELSESELKKAAAATTEAEPEQPVETKETVDPPGETEKTPEQSAETEKTPEQPTETEKTPEQPQDPEQPADTEAPPSSQPH